MAEYDPQEVYLTTRQAADLCHVGTAAIRQWVRRGHLEPVGRDGRGQMMFTQLAVAKAEYATRKHARRDEHAAA